MKLYRKRVLCGLAGLTFWLLHSSIAYGVENTQKVSPLVDEPSLDAIGIESLGIEITPLPGWLVKENHMGMSLVIMPPKDKKVVYGKVTFRPNLTVVAMHDPAPIDEKELNSLKDYLKSHVAKGAGTNSFSVDSHSFFDHNPKSKGLAVYTSFDHGDVAMSQLHMYVSGETNRFLLTFTDLASKFQDEAYMNKIWNMMTSMQVIGQPPSRYGDIAFLCGGIGLLFLLSAIFIFLRNRRARLDLCRVDREFSCEMASEDKSSESLSGSWADDLPKTIVSAPLSRVSDLGTMIPVSSIAFTSDY
mgnify:CR=1 FL=1